VKPRKLKIVRIKEKQVGPFVIEKLEIDLDHINYGLNSNSKELNRELRSTYTIEEVVTFFLEVNADVLRTPQIKKGYIYFTVLIQLEGNKKMLRLVFCVSLLQPDTAGIITMYQCKKEEGE
jgi:hypothetical protein